MLLKKFVSSLPFALLCSFATLIPLKAFAANTLIIDQIDSSSYGYGFNGLNNNPDFADFSFSGNGSDLLLSVDNFDIDTNREVSVVLNGGVVDHLAKTSNESIGSTTIFLPATLQVNGLNSLTFIETNPGWTWGVQNILLTSDTELALQPEVINTGLYGIGVAGLDSNTDSVSFKFPFSSNGYVLYVDTYDIDISIEVEVLVNDELVTNLATTGNNNNGSSVISIPSTLLSTDYNTVKFKSNFPNWIWSISNILLDSDTDVTLVLDQTEYSSFGYGHEGNYSQKDRADFQFAGTNGDMELSVETFDIDDDGEVTVLLNGQPIGNLETTLDNETGHSSIYIPQNLQNPGSNILSFVQTNPGWVWGVKRLLLYGCST